MLNIGAPDVEVDDREGLGVKMSVEVDADVNACAPSVFFSPKVIGLDAVVDGVGLEACPKENRGAGGLDGSDGLAAGVDGIP